MTPMLPDALLRAQSDDRLLVLAKHGDERAFEALVRRYRMPLVRFSQRMLRNDAQAEDVVQQALLSAWSALRQGTDVREIKPWLYRIVRHAALRALHNTRHEVQQLSDSIREPDTPEASFDRRSAVRVALAEVAALPPMQREALLMTAFAGHSNAGAARELGLTDSMVRGLLYRARVRLREACSAITPPVLVQWATNRASDGSRQLTERLAETGVGGAGTGGVVSLLTKGGAVALSALVIAAGTAQVAKHVYRHPPHASHRVGANAGSLTPSTQPVTTAGRPADDVALQMTTSAGSISHRGREHSGAGRMSGRDGRGGGTSGGDGGHQGRGGQTQGTSGGPGPSSSGSAGSAGEPNGDGGQGSSGPGPGGPGASGPGASGPGSSGTSGGSPGGSAPSGASGPDAVPSGAGGSQSGSGDGGSQSHSGPGDAGAP